MDDPESIIDAPGEVAFWHVVFLSGPCRSWWDVLTREPYRHVCAYGYSPALDGFILVDPGRGHTRVTGMTAETLGLWLAKNDERITEVLMVKGGNETSLISRLGYWCTTSVKRLLGVRSSAFTPEGLRRDLLRNNAEVVRSRENAQST